MMIFILAIMIIDLLIPFIIAIPYKGYSHSQTVMSVLGCKESPLGWVYNIWMIISGCVITLLGYTTFSIYSKSSSKLALILMILLVLYGIGDEVISGIFPVNEKKEEITVSSKIHGIGSVIGFIALQFAPLILAILEFKEEQILLGVSSIIFFVLSLIAFTFFIMGDKPKFKNTILALEGLWQRVLCLLMYTPFMIWIIARL